MSALPVLAIIGRPNVGKSTLFNALTKTTDALVGSTQGLTRDRQYAEIQLENKSFLLIDTSGFTQTIDSTLDQHMQEQTQIAIDEADAILWVVDAQTGLHPDEQFLIRQIREIQKPYYLIVNKVDGLNSDLVCSEFYQLGISTLYPIAASHRLGLTALIKTIASDFPGTSEKTSENSLIPIAVIGRPNVGKSTLLNRLIGHERLITDNSPGTTRDSIAIPFENYLLIDTAGIRKKYKQGNALEQLSVIKTWQAIHEAHVIILVFSAKDRLVDQDLELLNHALSTGKSIVMAANKWDELNTEERKQVKEDKERLTFLRTIEMIELSALKGKGIGKLFVAINAAYQSAHCELTSSHLNKILETALKEHQPPLGYGGRRIKLRYAHAGGHNPPTIVIHGNQTDKLPQSYLRYLENKFQTALQLVGTPIRLILRTGDNPFADKKNKLTPRQQNKRKRLLRHIKKKKKG